MSVVEEIVAPPDPDGSEGVLAILIRRGFRCQGSRFFTRPHQSQQVAFMSKAAGETVKPHVHNDVQREVWRTQEVLFLTSGKLRVDLYTSAREYVCTRTLLVGDVLILLAGGHGMTAETDCQLWEVKQGPYAGVRDKVYFKGV